MRFALGLFIAIATISLTQSQSNSGLSVDLPDGFAATVYASEDQLANPVSLHVADNGNIFVTESHRRMAGVFGVTFSRWWSMEDYAAGSLSERLAMYRRWSDKVPFHTLTNKADRIRLLIDDNHDSIADRSSIYAEDLNGPLAGNAAGILEHQGHVYVTCIPDLYRYQDLDRDMKADIRESLASGFGVRVGVHGHDLHGLTWGPEGRLYFTVGDRGFNLLGHNDPSLNQPRRGAVFRCEPDGSRLEVFHTGLRNPQEIAFDEFGNLFTVDNNMSGGDECRLLYLMEGGDSGWHAEYQLSQHFREETKRPSLLPSPWFTESLWADSERNQTLWVNPAIANFSRGPSGLAYYPGTGWSSDWNGRFFLADFVGTAEASGVLSFSVQPAGAGFALVDQQQFVWNTLVTDQAFGPDGALYLTDWISGWAGLGKGRIIRIAPTSLEKPRLRNETQALLARSLNNARAEELVSLLGHPDQRVRRKSQFSIAEKPAADAESIFIQALSISQEPTILRRIQAIWGLKQIGRRRSLSDEVARKLITLLKSDSPEIRYHAYSALEFVDGGKAFLALKQATANEKNLRALSAVLRTLAKVAHNSDVTELIFQSALLRGLDDPWFRQSAVTALAEAGQADAVHSYLSSDEDSARLLAALALRQFGDPRLGETARDTNELVKLASIRAIHDLPITSALPALAEQLSYLDGSSTTSPLIWRRILNAAYRLGTEKEAQRIVDWITTKNLTHDQQIEAWQCLLDWEQPSPFDRITWQYSPLPTRSINRLLPAIKKAVSLTLMSPSFDNSALTEDLLTVLQTVISKYSLFSIEEATELTTNSSNNANLRRASLTILESLVNPGLAFYDKLGADEDPKIRIKALIGAMANGRSSAKATLQHQLSDAPLSRRRDILQELRQTDFPMDPDLVRPAAQQLLKEQWPSSLEYELIDLCRTKFAEAYNDTLTDYQAKADGPGGYSKRALINGGDPDRGQHYFRFHAAQCLRCHSSKDITGGLAGPNLTAISQRLSPMQILTEIMDPNARLAPGYGTTQVRLKSGATWDGRLISSNEQELILQDPEDMSEMAFQQSEIAELEQAVSGMPEMREQLQPHEVRDIIAWLRTQ